MHHILYLNISFFFQKRKAFLKFVNLKKILHQQEAHFRLCGVMFNKVSLTSLKQYSKLCFWEGRFEIKHLEKYQE